MGGVAKKIGRATIPLGFLALVIGYGIIGKTEVIPLLYISSFLVGTGNALVLPCCMSNVTTKNKKQSTFFMSLIFAIANLGTFMTPIITRASTFIMKSNLTASRFSFAAIISAICGLISVSGVILIKCYENVTIKKG